MIRCRVVRRFTLDGTIDGHDPIGVTFKITGGLQPFLLTVVSVNWGRGYDAGEFAANVQRVLDRIEGDEYVVLLIQELDEADKAHEKSVLLRKLGDGWEFVGWSTHEPIALSPGLDAKRKRRTLTMPQGTDLDPRLEGTGPDRYLVTCVVTIEGVKIGLGNQHPHRNLPDAKVQRARRRGERITREQVAELLDVEGCDVVIHGGDMNDRAYPKSHKRERVAIERELDTIRFIVAA